MKTVFRTAVFVLLLFYAACAHHFPDENATDTYRQIDYSSEIRVHKEVCSMLEFVKIDGGILVMRYTTNKAYLVHAGPGEYLHGELGQIAFKVVSINSSRGVATVEYLYSTTRPSI